MDESNLFERAHRVFARKADSNRLGFVLAVSTVLGFLLVVVAAIWTMVIGSFAVGVSMLASAAVLAALFPYLVRRDEEKSRRT